MIFCLSQIKTRPIIGAADKEFMEKWSSIKTKAEKGFMALKQDFAIHNHCHYSDLSKALATQLEKYMGAEKYKDAEEAILTVANCIRAEEYTKLNGRWAYNLSNHEMSKYSVLPPKKKKDQGHSSDTTPKPGPSTGRDPRVYKKAHRRISEDYRDEQHKKYLNKVKAGKGRDDATELAEALIGVINKTYKRQ